MQWPLGSLSSMSDMDRVEVPVLRSAGCKALRPDMIPVFIAAWADGALQKIGTQA
jgi:hypothetical protein